MDTSSPIAPSAVLAPIHLGGLIAFPGVHDVVVLEAARYLRGAQGRASAMRRKLEAAAGADWAELLWHLARHGLVRPAQDADLLMVAADAADACTAGGALDVLAGVSSISALYADRGYLVSDLLVPGYNVVLDRLMWAAYRADRALVLARACELSRDVQRALWLVRARAGESIPADAARSLVRALRTHMDPTAAAIPALRGDLGREALLALLAAAETPALASA